MSRQDRAAELNELVKTEDGLSEIQAIYRSECPQSEGDGLPPTPALMIDAILNAEFPTRAPGHLAKH